MIRGTDRPPQAWLRATASATFVLALVTAGCGASNRPSGAAAEPAAVAPSTTAVRIAATAPFTPTPCPAPFDWVECGVVPTSERDAAANPLGGTFVAIVRNPDAPGSRAQRDAAIATIDVRLAEERATAARIAPAGADLLPVLEPALRIVQLEQERTAIASS
jgi:hypothetical protein